MKINLVAVHRLGRSALMALAAGACLFGVTDRSVGQEPKAPARKPAASDETAKTQDGSGFLVIQLKFADATQVQQLLMQIHGERLGKSASVVADPRTNSLIVRATSADSLEVIPAIVKKLDVPATDDAPARRLVTKIYRPQSITLDERVSQQLRVAISDQGRFAVDEHRNIVVVQDSHEALAAFEDLFRALDEGPADRRAPTTLQLRVVWLISGMERKDAQNLPADLKGVVGDLAKIGVDGLQLAAQTIVNTAASDRFQLQCSPDLDSPCDLKIRGSFSTPKGKMLNLQIEIGAVERAKLPAGGGGPAPSRTLCNLDTTISTPLGHFVVLGAAPVGKLTSVFVVQVTSGE